MTMKDQTKPASPPPAGDHETAAHSRSAFKLLQYFSLASLGAIVVATAIVAAIDERLAIDNLVRAQEQHHVALTRVSANIVWPRFSAFIRSSSALDADALRSHPETAHLNRMLQEELSGTRVLKIKIYDLSGRTAFSTEAKQIGEDKSKNAGFLFARGGTPASELTHRNQFSAFEQTVENVDVVQSYIPMHPAGTGGVEAVFEIYSDISPLLQRIRETRNAVVLRVSAVLLGLYLVLFLIVKHADSVIKQQHLQLRQDQQRLREARDEITRSEQFYRALIDGSSDAVLVLDADGTVRHASSTVRRVFSRDEATMTGTMLADQPCGEYQNSLNAWLTAAASRPGTAPAFEFEIEGDHPETGRRFLIANASNLLTYPAVHGIVVNVRDITARKRAEMQVRHLALHDGLTGLARRDFFREQAKKAISHAWRYGELVALLFLDLDGFKRINDTLGHDVGDALLKAVADRLRNTLREGDTTGRYTLQQANDYVARFGGDEFVILLGRLKDANDAAIVGGRILSALARPYDMRDGHEVTVTASIGIAVFPQDGTDADQLLKLADVTMYAAKNTGKNICRMASET